MATKRKTTKAKTGRPTKYDPAMCDRVVALGSEGKSKAQIAAALGITRDTLRLWGEAHAEFSAALKAAHDAALAWWEDAGQRGMWLGAKGFNATAFIFQMKNRFREDYRDVHEIKPDVGAFTAMWAAIGQGSVEATPA